MKSLPHEHKLEFKPEINHETMRENRKTGKESKKICESPSQYKPLSPFLFADDTNSYFETDDVKKLSKTVNKELKKVKSWKDCNKLSIKIDKTSPVLFDSPRKKLPDLNQLKFRKQIIKKT